MKSTNILMRVSREEKTLIQKAAADHKSVTAFLLWTVRFFWRHRRVIEQIRRIDMEYYAKSMKTPTLVVSVANKGARS